MTKEELADTKIWVLEPTWQNFSSMYREAVCAQEATTGREISHHRMAALYFGIATLECFINRKMTRHDLLLDVDHNEIYKKLRNPKVGLKEKLETWPEIITGNRLALKPETLPRILAINALRGQLTHLKNYWPEIFDDLGQTDPIEVVDLVAEYIIAFYRAKGELFPYWVWGWNYLNPSRDGYEIALLPYTQFFYSLKALGYRLESNAMYGIEAREQEILSSFEGYEKVADFLRNLDQCEPKWDRAPYQPKLCRRWWEPAHQQSCGSVSQAALERAFQIDEEYAARSKIDKKAQQATSPLPRTQAILSGLKMLLGLK